jgi:predicted dehydrogenase
VPATGLARLHEDPAIDLNHCYAEPVKKAKAAIQAGELGDIVFATWRFGGEPNFGTSPHANLIETQCHGLDMLEHPCGPITSVMAQMTNLTNRPPTPRCLSPRSVRTAG